MIRRINKTLKEFFDKQALTDFEKTFIIGCIKAQDKYPQLTTKQWSVVVRIKERYKYDEHSRSEEAAKR
jgi:hypothetical protein